MRGEFFLNYPDGMRPVAEAIGLRGNPACAQ